MKRPRLQGKGNILILHQDYKNKNNAYDSDIHNGIELCSKLEVGRALQLIVLG